MPDDISPYAFYPLALLTLVSALLTVRLKNVFHSALFLIVSFFGVAGMYLVLHAEFLSAAQVLVYTGAIAVLILFGVMLTHQVSSPPGAGQFRTMSWIPAVLCLLTAATLGYVLVRSPWTMSQQPEPQNPIVEIGSLLLANPYIVPFEAVSLILLAAIVGAIVLARKEKTT